jgi:hypothetical protein
VFWDASWLTDGAAEGAGEGVDDGEGVSSDGLSSGRCRRGRSSLELPAAGVAELSGVGDEVGDDDGVELSPGRFKCGRPSFGFGGAGAGSVFFATVLTACHLPSAVQMLPLEEFVIVT